MNSVEQGVTETRLDLWLDEAPRSWQEILKLFVEVGEKLAAAHDKGVLFQEIRIDNIVVGSDGRGDVRELKPAILDTPKIGPGNRAPPPRTAAIPLEQSLAEMKSTESVTYLAPEQFRGRAADARSNQFSYGVALYRALYRQPPYDHEWAVSQAGESRRTPLGSIHFNLLIQSFDRATLINLAREVLSGNLRPPPEDTTVPVWLELTLRRVLQADPEERYPTMRSLLDELTKPLQAPGRPGPVGLPGLPRWVVAGGVGMLVLLLGLAAIWFMRPR